MYKLLLGFVVITSLSLTSSCSDDNPNTSSVAGDEDSDAIPILNADTYEPILHNVIALINGDDLAAERQRIDLLASEISAMGNRVLQGEVPDEGFTFASQVDPVEPDSFPAITQQNYSCNAGGLLTVDLFDFHGGQSSASDTVFDQCQLADALYDGRYQHSAGRRQDFESLFEGFERQGGDGTSISIDGTWVNKIIYVGMGNDVSWVDTSYTSTNNTGVVEVSALNWQRKGFEGALAYPSPFNVQLDDGSQVGVELIDFNAELTASFDVSAPWSGQQPLSVSVDLGYVGDYYDWNQGSLSQTPIPEFPVSELGSPLTLLPAVDFDPADIVTVEQSPRDEAVQWETGAIRVSAADGSRIELRPLAGSSQVEITVNDSNDAIVRNWSDGFQVVCPAVIGVCQ